MDGWEWNKLAAALFGVLTFVLAVHLAAETIYAPAAPTKTVAFNRPAGPP